MMAIASAIARTIATIHYMFVHKVKCKGLTILLRLSKANHILGQDLWDSADSCRHDIETGASCFEDGNAKGLCQRCVQEDGTADQDL